MKNVVSSPRRILVIALFCLAFGFTATASSVKFVVTPDNLDPGEHEFSVSTTNTTEGVAFHVTVTAKEGPIFSDSTIKLVQPFGKANWKEPDPPVAITLKKDKKTWTADFTLASGRLKNPGLWLIFSAYGHATTSSGQTVVMPSVIFYEVRLGEFVH